MHCVSTRFMISVQSRLNVVEMCVDVTVDTCAQKWGNSTALPTVGGRDVGTYAGEAAGGGGGALAL